MRYPLDELLDKKSIIQLKLERIGKSEELKKEYDDYAEAIEEYVQENICTSKQVDSWYKRLYEINGKIWDLEALLRQGKEGKLGLEEVGRRAIEIRNNNAVRVAIKNEVVQTIGIGYKNLKSNHCSANK